MVENKLQPNEVLVKARIIDGNPAVLSKDEVYDPKGHYIADFGVNKNTKAEKRIQQAVDVALKHGDQYCYRGYSLVPPKEPTYDGDAEALRKPQARGMFVVHTKTADMPVLVNKEGVEDPQPDTWVPGTTVKVLISFVPYAFGNHEGVSASVKAVGLVKEADKVSALEQANLMFAADTDDDDEI